MCVCIIFVFIIGCFLILICKNFSRETVESTCEVVYHVELITDLHRNFSVDAGLKNLVSRLGNFCLKASEEIEL